MRQLFLRYFLLKNLSVFSIGFALGQPGSLPVNELLVVQENKLSATQLRDFQQLTEQKMAEFQKYLSVVADPEQQDNIREFAIENALLLFVPGATMQVGSARGVKAYPLPIYLRRLKNLDKKYFNIEMKFYDLALIGDWGQTTEGYVTTATYFQHFQAFNRKKQLVYKAKTAKKIDVDLRNRKDPFYEEHRWTVLLGDVRLAETAAKKLVQSAKSP
ncbi:MAG: hypothetical protein LH606_13570 [Cytophagaceae bacterium]|nr:hypothetical protein [Cytophagaceae bacterium]